MRKRRLHTDKDAGANDGGADALDVGPPDAPAADVAETDGHVPQGFVEEIAFFCGAAAARVCQVACYGGSVAGCLAVVESQCNARYGRFADAAVAGRFTIDRAARDRCLGVLDARCDFTVNPPRECQHVFAGTVADGAPCLTADECKGGACNRNAPSSCPGTCAEGGHVGDGCSGGDTDDCDPNTAYCNVTTHKCVAILADTFICDPARDVCVSGDFCDVSADTSCRPGSGGCRCLPLRGVGEPCGAYGECRAGLGCLNGACVAPPALGKPCDDANGVLCAGNLGCLRPITDGGTNGALGTCGERVAEGGKCLFAECQAELACVPDNDAGVAGPGTCRHQPTTPPPAAQADGEPCAQPEQCQSQICLGRTCAKACTLADLPK